MRSSRPKLPAQFESERLIFRIPSPSEAPVINAAIRASLPELRPWLPWIRPCPTVAQTRAFCRKAMASFATNKAYQYAMWLKESGTFVGGSGLIRGDAAIPMFEIGYWIDTRLVGNGYATETVHAFTELARRKLKIKRLELRIDSLNTKSQKVAERSGYVREGVLRQNARNNRGQLQDTCVFAKIF